MFLQSVDYCFCGNKGYTTDNNGYDVFGKSKNCKTPCPGDASKVCGGSGAISVHNTGKGKHFS